MAKTFPDEFRVENLEPLPLSYYLHDDVVWLARDLLGKMLAVGEGKEMLAGIITETEAYAGVTDRASHAWNGRCTERTEVLYRRGGIAYVYFTYGMHYLFNVVTNVEGQAHAILVRAIQPSVNIPVMEAMRGIRANNRNFSNGPAKLTKALGISRSDNGCDLVTGRIRILDAGVRIPGDAISVGPRIGIDYAGEDAVLPYRFVGHMVSQT